MKTKRIVTEDPRNESWRMLSQFHYEPNIKRYCSQRSINPDATTLNYIAGSMRQGEAYFASAQQASLDIKPLLLYYGLTNLMVGTSALMSGNIPPVKSHGMAFEVPQNFPQISDSKNNAKPTDTGYQYDGIAAYNISPKQGNTSGLFYLVSVFSSQSGLKPDLPWTLGEIFGSLPDLRNDYLNRYDKAPSFVIPVEVVRRRRTTFERVSPTDLQSYASQFQVDSDFYIGNFLNTIQNFETAYLPIQREGGNINLRRKLNGFDVGMYSMFGKKFLSLPHIKSKGKVDLSSLVTLAPLIVLLMGLYALATLSRYHPEIWNPFVERDDSGERLVVEQFLRVVQRYAPNLVLNEVDQERYLFVPPTLEGSVLSSIQESYDFLEQQNGKEPVGNPIPSLWNIDEMRAWIQEITVDILEKRKR